MISICIPIYNFDVNDLVKKLRELSEKLNVTSEIILIDDCSSSNYKALNQEVCAGQNYIPLEKNIGRAAIRNLFLDYAQYDNLLFLDCDSIVYSDDFLSKYLDAIKNHPEQIICGGRIYPQSAPERNKLLRWEYGIKKESKSVEERMKYPNKSFMTNNFVLRKKTFNRIKFDEALVEYGHEDTLFGFELKKMNIQILHIDNPILNGDLESNENYLKNTEEAIHNLVVILEKVNFDKELIEDVSLLKSYYKLYPYRKLIASSFKLLKPGINYLLSNGYVNLVLFNYYKLGSLSLELNKINRK